MALYLLVRGEAEVYKIINNENGEQVQSFIKSIYPGEIFGHYSFFSDNPNEYSIRSKIYSTLYRIEVDRFYECIHDNTTDLQTHRMIRDQLRFLGKSDLLNLKCYLCNKEGHHESKCGLLKF